MTSLRLEWAQRRLSGDAALAVVDSIVQPGSVVVDAGAERGFFTARLADLVGPEGTVHAVEPNPDFQLDGIAPNVRVHRVALSDQAGRGVLHVPRRHGRRIGALGSLAPRPESDDFEVDLIALDDLLEEGPVGFIKIDVEGHELAVLRGAAATLARDKPVLFVEIERRHAGERTEATFALLDEAGYRGEAIGPAGRFPLADFDVSRDQLAFLDQETATGDMPAAYVHDFLFTPR